MSNITPIRAPVPQWGGGGGGPPQGGWMWNGMEWIWPGPPPCPPQQCGPPSCNSAIAKAQACYDQSQSLYNLVSQVVSDIFAKNPGIIPSPPPTAGSGPILGVTDGSVAQPGQVGEVLTNVFSGTVSSAAPSSTFPMLTVSPGDWDVWAWLEWNDPVWPSGMFFTAIELTILNGSTGVMVAGMDGLWPPSSGFAQSVLVTNTYTMNVAVPTLLSGAFAAEGITSGLSANFQICCQARRRR